MTKRGARLGIVRAPSRLHFGLLDTAGHTGRRYGGSGMMIREPATKVAWTLTADPANVVAANPQVHFDQATRHELEEAIAGLTEWSPVALTGTISIVSRPATHHGFGSKTSLVLAVLAAVAAANQLQVTPNVLRRLSRRGGTSGIGVHGFFCGGLIVDRGHRPDDRPFGPSSLGPPRSVPELGVRAAFPRRWSIGTIDVPGGRALAGGAERAVFTNGATLPAEEVNAAMSAVYHGVVPAVRDVDMALLKHSLGRLRRIGFKRLEVAAQAAPVGSLLDALDEFPRVAVGMSSMGPTVFVVRRSTDAVARAHVEKVVAGNTGGRVTWTTASNHGAVCSAYDSAVQP